MEDQSFEEWRGSPHLNTFIHLRLRELDQKPVQLDHLSLLENEARRKELRELETWLPKADVLKPERQAHVNYKAGEFVRNLNGRA